MHGLSGMQRWYYYMDNTEPNQVRISMTTSATQLWKNADDGVQCAAVQQSLEKKQ